MNPAPQSTNTTKEELYKAFLLLKNTEEVARFLTDLCTPQELENMAERWNVCKLLDQGDLTYRDINEQTGASLTTITRVARCLKIEPHQGYSAILQKIKTHQ